MKTRSLALPVLMLCAALSGACTTMSPQPASNLPVFLGQKPIDLKHEYIDRYSCANGTLLYCACDSRMAAATCRCACPAF